MTGEWVPGDHMGALASGTVTCGCGFVTAHHALGSEAIAEWEAHLDAAKAAAEGVSES